ncbi:hypothetical protein NPIL_376541 [Nephila pilipes]|uniref:Uncharacterized protein n=1 Tax=Nephila pilipes TaxID=299642 RepID=A0A8X6U4S3_NEPPI|nr:hypothetical protein NPIL_376541 [Nephila pilipes]
MRRFRELENLRIRGDEIDSDASITAYGCVVFLRGVTHDNRIIVKFVYSKSRVAPLKSVTLPSLELLGCLLSSRLSNQKLAPFLDDNNVLRVKGSLEESVNFLLMKFTRYSCQTIQNLLSC